MSFPSPPTSLSLPASPTMESLPASPTNKSPPVEPISVSFPDAPRMPTKPDGKLSISATPDSVSLRIKPASPMMLPAYASYCACVSARLAELASIFSMPARVAVDKSTSPPVTRKVSVPSPPSMVSSTFDLPLITIKSLPLPALTRSTPAPALMVSLPSPPVTVSLPPKVVKTSPLLVPFKSKASSPLTESLAPPMRLIADKSTKPPPYTTN